MFKDKIDRIKNIFKKNKSEDVEEATGDVTSKRKIENLVVFLVILIVTLIVINVIWNDNSSNEESDTQTNDQGKVLAKSNSNDSSDTNETYADSNYNLASNLEDILSNITGVGNVKVMITYAETSTTIPVYNEESTEENTEETDSEGGTRTVTQTDVRKEVIYEEQDGNKSLITQKITSPEVEGAIITAEGADNAEIKTSIIQAVEAVTGLPTHKIQVFKMSS